MPASNGKQRAFLAESTGPGNSGQIPQVDGGTSLLYDPSDARSTVRSARAAHAATVAARALAAASGTRGARGGRLDPRRHDPDEGVAPPGRGTPRGGGRFRARL